MPRRKEHLQQAKHNEELALDLIASKPIKYKDWALTTIFYAMLHYAEASFYEMPDIKHTPRAKRLRARWDSDIRKCPTHLFRVKLVKDRLPKEVGRLYEKLWSASQLMRYLDDECEDEACPTKGEFYKDKEVRKMVNEAVDIRGLLLESA